MSIAKHYRSYSIVRFFLFCLLLITVVSTAIIGYSWISSEYSQYSEDTARLTHDYVDAQKKKVFEETGKVIDYIRYVRSNKDLRLRELLKERVYEAHSIAHNIYRKYRGKKSLTEIKKLIKEALRPIRFSRGRGYFYVHRMDGILELYPVKPQKEGENQLLLRDKNGIYVVKREVDLLKKQNEGFLVNTWRSDGKTPGRVFTKVSFIKRFDPLDWYIGSKEYREDFAREIQEKVLERISKIRFGKNGYIFVFDFDGVVLMNDTRRDLIGKNLWNIKDLDGNQFVREMRRKVEKNKGGFVEYTWSKPEATRLAFRKISYVASIYDWRWIIGSGVYLDEIDVVIAKKHGELKKIVRSQVLKIIGLFLLIVVVVFFITMYFSRRLKREFEVFISCFKESSISHAQIDKNRLNATELMVLADSANQVLEERSRIEHSLRESEERLAVTFRSIRDGVIATDTHGRIVLMNRAAENLTGHYLQRAIGKTVETILTLENEQTKEPMESPAVQTLESGEPVELRESVSLLQKNENRRAVACSAAPIRDKDNKIVGAVMILQDISERKKMEEELQKAHKLESLGLLAGGIAHDFNNLLTGVLGNITLAKTLARENGEINSTLTQAEKAVLQSKRLTQQLLTFARGSAPIKMLHLPGELVRDAVSFVLRGSRIKCNYRFPDGLWAVNVDAGQIVQVFNNLALNALQAMSVGGAIDVSAENIHSGADTGLPLDDRKYVKITLEDYGPGIQEEIIKRIFDPYFSTKPKGSGLGLTSAYSIVKKHDGIIQVESQPGKGAAFTVYLPAVDKKIKRTTGRENGEPIKGEGRILVMDDDLMVADVADKLLLHLGYRTVITKNGTEAIAEYKKAKESGEPFDAVIMDLTIPGGMGGADALQKLLEYDPYIKAVVSSGYSTDPVMADYKKYGFSARIVKPYLLQELSKILKQLVLNSRPGERK